MVTIIIIALILLVCGIFVWRKIDWEALESENDQYYVDGLHTYYDRKLIAQLEKERGENNNDRVSDLH